MSVFYQDAVTQILLGDVRTELATLPDRYVQMCVTSPPYWGLRDYSIEPQVWGGLPRCQHRFEFGAPTSETNYTDKRRWQHTRNGRDELQPKEKRVGWKREKVEHGTTCRCGAWRGSLGLEPTPELYVEHLVDVFREVRRVLKDDGTLWLNLGDSYAGSRQGWMKDGSVVGGPKQKTNMGSMQRAASTIGFDKPRNYISSRQENGLKPKDLVGIPWRVAFALQADGWYLRSDIIWHKPNPMPESVTDRPTKAHEYLFLMAKSESYYCNMAAIKEPASGWNGSKFEDGKNLVVHENVGKKRKPAGWDTGPGAYGTIHRDGRSQEVEYTEGISKVRNKRTVWTIATQPYAEAHFATFPPKLIEPCILAGSRPTDIVADIFHGAGTSAMVAKQLGRRYVGIELNQAYIEMSLKRIQQEVLSL